MRLRDALRALGAVAAAPAAADVLDVPDDFPTVEQAIEAAVDGDEVTWRGSSCKDVRPRPTVSPPFAARAKRR